VAHFEKEKNYPHFGPDWTPLDKLFSRKETLFGLFVFVCKMLVLTLYFHIVTVDGGMYCTQ
jgi:hypothetical protein